MACKTFIIHNENRGMQEKTFKKWLYLLYRLHVLNDILKRGKVK